MSVFTAAAFFWSANLTCHLRLLVLIWNCFLVLVWYGWVITELQIWWISFTQMLRDQFSCVPPYLVVKGKENVYYGKIETLQMSSRWFSLECNNICHPLFSHHVCYSIFCCATDSTWISSLLLSVFLLFSCKCPINMTAWIIEMFWEVPGESHHMYDNSRVFVFRSHKSGFDGKGRIYNPNVLIIKSNLHHKW